MPAFNLLVETSLKCPCTSVLGSYPAMCNIRGIFRVVLYTVVIIRTIIFISIRRKHFILFVLIALTKLEFILEIIAASLMNRGANCEGGQLLRDHKSKAGSGFLQIFSLPLQHNCFSVAL